MVTLLDGVAFSREFDQKGAQRRWSRCREAVFPTEVDIKPDPFMVILMEGLRHMLLVQVALETVCLWWRLHPVQENHAIRRLRELSVSRLICPIKWHLCQSYS